MSNQSSELLEAKRKLTSTSRRRPSTTNVDRNDARSPQFNWKNLNANRDRPDNRFRKLSGTSSASVSSDKQLKWVDVDGKGTWKRIKVIEVTDEFKDEEQARSISGEPMDDIKDEDQVRSLSVEQEDDFKDEDQAGSISGEQSDQYWAELNDDRERNEGHIYRMFTEFIDVPEIIVASEDVHMEHREEISSCEVSKLIEDDTVKYPILAKYL